MGRSRVAAAPVRLRGAHTRMHTLRCCL
jgi:hypothetical protein